jgi:hypothetical protein
MESLILLGRTLGFSLAAGVNLYATVAVLGLAARYQWVALPEQFQAFDHDWVIGIALALYAVEFLADKIPWLDSAWDAGHTFIRPLGGAVIAITTLGEASPLLQGVVGLAGGAVAAGSHLSKAGTRAAVNASPEPFSNWALSIAEDAFVIGLGLVAIMYPLLALLVVALAVVAIVLLFRWLVIALRRSRHAPAVRS